MAWQCYLQAPGSSGTSEHVYWKHTLSAGAMSGAIIAILMLLLLATGDVFFELFETAVLSALSIILIQPFLTRKIWQEKLNAQPSLLHLIPVSFLTFFMPVLGASFGGPSLGVLSYWLMLPVFAAVGGAFWSLPFAGWNYYSSTRDP